jgi:hypothetical protein
MDMRKVGPLLLLVITALLLANGVALAATIRCSNSSDPLSNFCMGTDQNDTMIGTDWDDPTYGDDRMLERGRRAKGAEYRGSPRTNVQLTSDGSGSKIRYPDNSAVVAQLNQSHP